MIKYYDGDNNYMFYCTAANLLDLEDFKKVYEEVEKETEELTLDDKANTSFDGESSFCNFII